MSRDRKKSVVAIEDDMKVLQVDVVSGKSLPSMDRNGLCDCYVAIFLDEKKKKGRSYKTEVKRCTLAPRWEFERWTIRLPKDCNTLYLKAKDWDRMSRNDFIGQASIKLQDFKGMKKISKLKKKKSATNFFSLLLLFSSLLLSNRLFAFVFFFFFCCCCR
jgi:Ca2+-dependent lipid-binding protein